VSRYIDEHRGRFGVEPICRVLGASASAYYERRKGQRSARELEDERLLQIIRETHKQNYEAYGYRRLWKALKRAGERQVQRLMRQHGIQGAKRRGKRGERPSLTSKRHRGQISSSETSRSSAPPRCGWPTSSTCAAGRGLSSSRS
jgi:transposase InsO family protein